MTSKTSEHGPRSHRFAATTLLVVGTITAIFAIGALWINRQVMDTENWTETSSQLLEDTAIRGAVSDYVVDQLYANVDVTGELQKALPTRAEPLAGPAAGALRNLAEDLTDKVLQRPRVQALWENANEAAHETFIKIVKDEGENVSTAEGVVTLDLRGILENVAERTGVGTKLVAKIPPDAAQLTVMKSDQLAMAQDVARILRPLAILLLLIAFGCYAAAVWIARPRRRETLRAVGLGFIVAGAAVLIARSVGGDAVVNALASTEAVRPAAESVWAIGTSLLVEAAWASVLYGVVFVFAAWLAGPSGVAVSCRRGLAPYLREPRYAWGGLVAIVLLLVIWGPTPATRSFFPLLVLAGLIALGIQALRRQTGREYPEAGAPAVGASLRSGYERLRSGASERASRPAAAPPLENGTPGPTTIVAAEDPIAKLERLAALRDRGVLTDEEFATKKRDILAGV